MSTQGRAAAAAGMLVAVCLVAPVGAGASVTVGADLTQAVNSGCGYCSALTLTKSSGMPETGSPVTGVLVSARVKTQGPGANGWIRVLRETSTANSFHNAGEAAFTAPTNDTPGGEVTTVLTRIPIQAGDRIAVAFPNNAVNYLRQGAPASCTAHIDDVDTNSDGTDRPYSTSFCGAAEVLANGTVEADADGDGYGDETQDLCPSDPTQHLVACPSAAPPQLPATPNNKKCKKAKKKSAAAAKKKCKKKR